MRNLVELIGIIKGIRYDGVINDREVERLEQWLSDNIGRVRKPAEIEMAMLLEEILEDHVITLGERIRLVQKSEEILKGITDNYAKIYELNGILMGIVCDDIVNENETRRLLQWLKSNDDFVVAYRNASKVREVINEVLYDGVITKEEQSLLLKQLNEIVNNLEAELSDANRSEVLLNADDGVRKHRTNDSLLSQDVQKDDNIEVLSSEEIVDQILAGRYDYKTLYSIFNLSNETLQLLENRYIEENDFSRRLYNALKRAKKDSWFDVLSCTPLEIKLIRNIGATSIKELVEICSNKKNDWENCDTLNEESKDEKVAQLLQDVLSTSNDDKVMLYKLFGFDNPEEIEQFKQIHYGSNDLSYRTHHSLNRCGKQNVYDILYTRLGEIRYIWCLDENEHAEIIRFLFDIIDKRQEETAKSSYNGINEVDKGENAVIKHLSRDALGVSCLLVPEHYDRISCESLQFSFEVEKWLEMRNILTMEDLLRAKVSDIDSSVRKEIIKKIEVFSKSEMDTPFYIQYDLDKKIINEIDFKLDYYGLSVRPRRVLQRQGITSFVGLLSCTIDELSSFNNMGETSLKETYYYLRQLVEQNVMQLSGLVSDETLHDIYEDIPYFKRKNKAEGYAIAYSRGGNIRGYLMSQEETDCVTLKELYKRCMTDDSIDKNNVRAFFRWCAFNVKEEVKQFFSKYSNGKESEKRELEVLQLRSEGRTLEECGEAFGVTRERVRQIEKKARVKVRRSILRNNIFMKIYADRNQDEVLTREELTEFFGEYTSLIIDIIKKDPASECYYDHWSDAIIIGGLGIGTEVEEFVDGLEDILSENDYNNIINEGLEKGLNEELLKPRLTKEYKQEGTVYHRRRLGKKDIYIYILKKYYSDGIRVYDEKTLREFREKVYKEFGEVDLPKNDRAISARLGDLCVLSGRGTYKPRTDEMISNALLDKIIAFIDEYPMDIISYATVFNNFEDELIAEKIDNRYYLQGILRENLEDKYNLKKDYIVKGEKDIVFSEEVRKYVKSFSTPVTKTQIMEHFSVGDSIAIQFALSESDIINMWGSYIYAGRLIFSDDEINYLRNSIEKKLRDSEYFHSKDLFSDINFENEIILKRNGVYNYKSLFSVVKYLFEEDYQFARPYIGSNDAIINKPDEIVDELIKDKEVIEIDEILEVYKEMHTQLNSILDKVNSLNEEYLFMNRTTIASIDYIGINDEKAKQVESMIVDEIEGTVAFRDLKCIFKLPKINVNWTDWLLYSVVRKYSTKLETGTSASQLRMAIPVVAKTGEIDIDGFNSTYNQQNEDIEIDTIDMDDLDQITEMIIEEGEI